MKVCPNRPQSKGRTSFKETSDKKIFFRQKKCELHFFFFFVSSFFLLENIYLFIFWYLESSVLITEVTVICLCDDC